MFTDDWLKTPAKCEKNIDLAIKLFLNKYRSLNDPQENTPRMVVELTQELTVGF